MDVVAFSSECVKQAGGYLSLSYAPISFFNDAVTWRVYDNKLLAAPTFATGKTWLTLPILPSTEKDYEVTTNITKFSPLTDVNISAVLSAVTPENLSAVERMLAAKYFIVLVTDRNYRQYVVGTLDNPVEFTVKTSGGKNAASTNNIVLNFKGKLRNNPLSL